MVWQISHQYVQTLVIGKIPETEPCADNKRLTADVP